VAEEGEMDSSLFQGDVLWQDDINTASGSQNRVLKEGYVNESTSLHMFARRMLDSLHHADHIDAGETHYAQVMYNLQMFALAKLQHFG
jgi:putative heme iron utilization protein